jgi:prepilin-type N-terminal cleavage/methylation domain-containing protein
MTRIGSAGRRRVIVVRGARPGVTLLELIIVLAIIGILLAMLFPALQALHQHARRTECDDHIRQLSLALSMYIDANRAFPPPPPDGRLGGWSYAVLPYMEETPLANLFNVNQQVTSPRNVSAAARRPALFVCPVMPDTADSITGIENTFYLLVVDPTKRNYEWKSVRWMIKDVPEGSRYSWCTSPEMSWEQAAYPAPHPTPFGF